MPKPDKAATSAHSPLSYHGPPSGGGYEAWREHFGRKIMNVDFTPLSDGIIDCDVTASQFGPVRLSGSQGSPLKFTSLGADSTLVLIYSPDATVHAQMGKREATVERGAFILGDSSISGAYASQLETGQFRTILFEREALMKVCPSAEQKVGQRLLDDPLAASLLKMYFDAISTSAVDRSPQAGAVFSQHVLDLAALVLGASGDERAAATGRSLNAARLAGIKQIIMERLTEPTLNLHSVARAYRASPRTIQLVFEAEGESFSVFVLEQRLLLAYRTLVNPLHAHRKISDIAHSAGFGDVSHFHKYFRRRFAATPAEVRETAVRSAE